jgi:hypothetical protein
MEFKLIEYTSQYFSKMFFVKVLLIIVVTTSAVFSAPQWPVFSPYGWDNNFSSNFVRSSNDNFYNNFIMFYNNYKNFYNNQNNPNYNNLVSNREQNNVASRIAPDSNEECEDQNESSPSSCASYLSVQNNGMEIWGQLSISEPFEQKRKLRIGLSISGSIPTVSTNRSEVEFTVYSMNIYLI